MSPVPIKYSDLQLLHDLFCEAGKPFSVYDPEQRIEDNIKNGTTEEHCDFNLSSNGHGSHDEMKFYFGKNKWESGRQFLYINNPDGTMRWLMPAANTSAAHLHLYNSKTLKAQLYKLVTKMLYRSGHARWLATDAFRVEQNLDNAVKRKYGIRDDEQYAVFTGTRGNNRKIVLALDNGKTVTAFIKIPISEQSQKLVENEVKMLKELSKYDFTSLSVPRVTDSRIRAYARLSNIKPAVTIPAQRITDIHIRTLTELYSFNHERKAISESAAWKTISNNMEWLQKEHQVNNGLDEIKTRRVIHLLRKLYNSFDESEVVAVSVSHGDFTPWNMYCDVHRLYVYDWELSSNGIPMLFDLYHFIFQSQVLVHHKKYADIKKSIDDTVMRHNVQRLVNKYRIDSTQHYRLYLLFTVSYYMRLYIEESELLLQSHWMVDAWTDALEDVNR